MTPKQKEQYFRKQQEALARISKIEPMTEVVNTTSEQATIDRDNSMLDAMFDYISVKLGIHEDVLNYEPDENDIYDEMPTEKTLRNFINLL